ncbi:hypothetical protein LINPERPRIM_LOCUS34127, partial [Linum perenne]
STSSIPLHQVQLKETLFLHNPCHCKCTLLTQLSSPRWYLPLVKTCTSSTTSPETPSNRVWMLHQL